MDTLSPHSEHLMSEVGHGGDHVRICFDSTNWIRWDEGTQQSNPKMHSSCQIITQVWMCAEDKSYIELDSQWRMFLYNLMFPLRVRHRVSSLFDSVLM